VVVGLERHPDVHTALTAAGVPDAEGPAYLKALAGLAEAGTIEPRPETTASRWIVPSESLDSAGEQR
jgi:hypothetical protein